MTTKDTSMWPHQEEMVRHVLKLLARPPGGALLAAEMGTGKSRAAIEVMRALEWPKTLILAPKTVVKSVWPYQIRKWEVNNSEIGTVDGSTKTKEREQIIKGNNIVAVNYDLAPREPVASTLMQERFGLLILDESHRIKSPSGKQSRFVSRLTNRIPRRLALTGTPMPHSPLDIYAQFRALDRRVFGPSVTGFRNRYCVMGGFENRQIVGWRNKEELKKKIDSLMLQIKIDDVLKIPDFVDTSLFFELNSKTRDLYESAKRAFVLDVQEGRVTIANALARLLKLQQITSGFLLTSDNETKEVDTSKSDLLIDVLTDCGDEHVVVFCRFINDLNTIRKAATKTSMTCFELSGRRNELEEWQAKGGVLAAQIQAGSVGIDMSKARTCVFYSLGFSLGDYLQAKARVRRPGQEKQVHYIYLIAKKTVDIAVLNSMKRKQNVIANIVNTTKQPEGWQGTFPI